MRTRNESRLRLLGLVFEENGEIISGASLAEKLKISRQAVSNMAETLRGEGIPLESVPQKGYRLRQTPENQTLSPTWTEYLLRNCPWGHPIVHFASVPTTQSVARQLAQQGAEAGTVVCADEQTAGRGRRDRSWFSLSGGGIYTSILLRPALAPGDVQLISFAASLAVCSALRDNFGIPAEIKWPNDVLVNGRKICGILCESAGEPERIYYAIAGLGINVNLPQESLPEDIQSTATSLRIELGHEVSRSEVLASVITHFYRIQTLLEEGQSRETFLDLYRKHCSTLGKRVRVIVDDQTLPGLAEDFTPQGALLVNIEGCQRAFAAADVVHLRKDEKE